MGSGVGLRVEVGCSEGRCDEGDMLGRTSSFRSGDDGGGVSGWVGVGVGGIAQVISTL